MHCARLVPSTFRIRSPRKAAISITTATVTTAELAVDARSRSDRPSVSDR